MSQKSPESRLGGQPAAAVAFAALGDARRLLLVRRLAAGRAASISELTGELTGGAQITRQAVAKHLRVLERAGIVRSEHAGRETRFLLNRRPLHDLQLYLESVSRQWDDALSRLKTFVEE